MSLNFNINTNNKTTVSWDTLKLKQRLTNLKNAKKDVVWIRTDLRTKRSSGFSRLFWQVIGKHFNWIRKAFYKIDLENTKGILNELKGQVKQVNDQTLTQLFNEAVLNFNTVAPNHSVNQIHTDGSMINDELAYKKELDAGASKDFLLVKAFHEKKPSVAAWLLNKGADISVLEARTREEIKLLSWLTLQLRELPATPENIDHFALDLGGGYKYANLKIMEAKADEMSRKLKSSKVTVPPFLSLGDFEMTHALAQEIPEVFTLWTEFLDTFDSGMKSTFIEKNTAKEAAKVPVKISEEGEKKLAEIKEKIINYFDNEPYFSLQMKEWLEKENPQFLIVRSTGKEDSDTSSNAGGNESVPFVEAKSEDISHALGVVVASYFGQKSITQRLAAGDRSVFEDEKPFVPVLLQVMVGENVAGKDSKNEDVPRCGVLFTRQSDKAEGVTFIQTGLGNNEGVVSSQVGVDSYFVKDGKIHAVVRKKETRFVSIQESSGKYTVAPIANNDRSLEMNQALPNPVILDIKRVADDISESYASEAGKAKPMDMEYVVKLKEKGHDKPVIYLLQARPLLDTQDKEGIEHTYLDLGSLRDVSTQDRMTAETLLDGNAYVRKVEDASEIIFVDDLPRGLDAYLKASDPGKIKVIVSRKTAPATSHEAVTLRPKGVAVMVVNDTEQFKSLKKMAAIATKDKPLLADTQRGLFVKTPKERSPNEMIKKGLVSYPIPLEATIPPSRFMGIDKKELAVNEGLQHLVKALLIGFNNDADKVIRDLQNGKKLQTTKKKEPGFFGKLINKLVNKEEEQVFTLRELFDVMATGETEEAKRALGTILELMKKRLVKSMKETDDFRADINQPMFQVFEAAINLAKKELIPALEKYEPQSLERLYHLKFLEAMIFQTPGNNVMGAPSYAQVLTTDATQRKAMEIAAEEGIDVKNSDGQMMLILLKMSHLAFSEECSANWKEFIKDITKLPAEEKAQAINDLMRVIIDMNKVDMTSIWINKVFQDQWKKVCATKPAGAPRAREMLNEIKAVQSSNKDTIQWITQNLYKLEAREQQISQWGDPKFVKKNTKKLIASFKGGLGFDPTGKSPTSISALYQNSDNLGRLALMQYMRRGVDIYDRTIKTAKGSTEFKDDKEKAQAVGELLKGYFAMMQATFKLIPDISEQKEIMKDGYGDTLTFDSYTNRLKNGYKYDFGFKNVHASIGFDNLVHYLTTGERKHSLTFENTSSAYSLKDQAAKSELEAMFPIAESEYNKQFTQQLEATKRFSVDSLIIGSKADLNFSTHWPNRLEEYFTTFHQNMEQVIKYLNTKNGMDTSLLSTNAKGICDTVTTNFGVQISSLGVENDNIVVGYQIPLRQHSGSLSLKYNPKKPDGGLDLEVQMFGNDEERRWDKSAAVGVLLAHLKGAGLTDDTSPEIDYYPMPTGMKFSIHLSSETTKTDQENIIKTLVYLMKTVTMDGGHSPKDLLKNLENGYHPYYGSNAYPGMGKIDWEKIPEESFAHTLWFNVHLLSKFNKEGNDAMAAKVAVNSLLGIARRKLDDYDRQGGDSHSKGHSLKQASVDELKRLVQKKKKTYGPLVAQLIADPDVKEQLKDVCIALS